MGKWGSRARERPADKKRIGDLARRRPGSIALSVLSSLTIALSSLTLALAPIVAPVTAPAAEAYEAPTAAQLVRTSNNVWTQTTASGLQITYSTGTSTTYLASNPADTADTGSIRGTPVIGGNAPLATFTGAVPAVTASGCTQPNTSVGRWICANQATVTITFSQPVTNPRLYIGRLGGSQNNQARIFGAQARLTASAPSGVTLTNATGATSTFTSSTTGFGVSTDYTGVSGLCTDGTDSTGCGSLQLTGNGITSLTFAIDMDIRQALFSNQTGGSDEFTMLVSPNQQFSNGPASYNGTGGTSAPFHVQGPLQLGAAFTTAGISTTQNTTASPTAGTATGAGDAFTASSFLLRAASAGSTVSLTVPLSGTTQAGRVCGWLDWDHSGTYETGERACASFAAGATSASLSWTMPAAGTTAGPVNARFRAAFGSTDLAPTGGADSGEVEDYTFAVKPTISVTNSASSTAGATFTYGVTAGSATATLLSNGAPGATSGLKSIYHNSTYGAPDITVTQDITTTAIPLTFTQTQPSTDTSTYGVTYSCVNAAGTTVASGSLGNSGAGTVKTIPQFSLPANAATNVAAQSVACTFTNTKRVTTAANDTATVAQNGSVSTNVLANDSTTSGAALSPSSVTVTTAPANGTTSVNTTTGAITYTPTPGFVGTDTYTYRVCDSTTPTPVCGTATVTVTVTGNTVVATDDSASTTPGTAVSTNVRANDTSATGQALANPTVVTAPSRGTVSVNTTTGAIVYTPNSGFSGVDSYTYRVCDTSATPVCSQPATVTVTVPNQFTNGPAAGGITTAQNTAKVLQTSDIVTVTGAPINPAAVTITSQGTKGVASVNTTTGAVTYTPNPGYTGTDSFTVQLCDTSSPTVACRSVVIPVTVGANTVGAVNDSATTPPSTAVTIDVKANDTTATGQPLGAPAIVTAPSKGTVAVNGNGTVLYTPNAGFSGVDTFVYRICDTSNPTPVCANATVTVTVPNQFTNGPAAAGITTPQNTAKVLQSADIVTTSGAPVNPAGITVTTAPAHGSVSINTGTGAVTYTPAAGYSGPDTFTLQACDTSTPTPSCRSVVVPVTVGGNTVTAADDAATTNPSTAVVIPVKANDTTATGQALGSPTVLTAPVKGTAVVNANGTVTYTPGNGFSGVDTFTYRICDTSTPTPFCSSAATVTVTVPNQFTNGAAASGIATPQNTAKVLQTSDIVTVTGAPINPAATTQVTAPAHGTISINASNGAVTYTPAPGYTGSDSFAIQVCDTSSPTVACRTVTIPVTVGANTVTAVNDTASTTPATAVSINVRANDTTASGQALANPTIVTAPAKGTATVNATTGAVLYTPNSGFSGTDTFTYRVCDTSTPTPVCSTTATVTVNVPNQFTTGPAAAGITTPQNTAKVLATGDLVTVTGAPVNPAAITVTAAPAHGSVSINTTTGQVTYTPAAGYSGSDSFTVQLCDTSTPTPSCRSVVVPVTVGANTVTAVNDTANTTPGTAVDITVKANDTSASSQPLGTPAVQTAPAHGTAVVNTTTGQIRYTPAAGWSGVDTFSYTICDTSTPTPFCSAAATVTVNVPNQFTDKGASIVTPQNTAKTLQTSDLVTVTGAPINPAAVTVTSAPAHGSTSVNATTGAVTFTPAPGYTGTDTFTVQLCDTSTPTVSCRSVVVPVTVGANTVTAVNDSATTAPATTVQINVRANDTTASGQALANPVIVASPARGTATVNATTGAIAYTPNAGFSGVDTFTYRVCDTSTPTPVCSTTATVTVTVPNQFTNGAAASGISTAQNTATVLQTSDVVATTGAPINPAAITVTSAPAHGSVSVNTTSGAITYTPAAGYTGTDSFTLQLCDTSSPTPACRSVVIPVTVGANAVTATNDSATTAPGAFVDIDVRANDTTATGQPLANPTVVSAPSKGTAVVNAGTGAIRYTPNAGFSGVDTFTYRVCDTSNPTPVCDTATVTVTVPNQFTDKGASISTPQNTSQTLALNAIVTVTGAPINPAAVTVTAGPAHGTVSVNATSGAVTYTPTPGYAGTDSFTLQACDTSTPTVACRSFTIPVTVGGNTVTAVNDTAATTPGTAVDINVTGNDTTTSGQALANPVVQTQPAHGTASVSATTGRISYTPAAGFSGTDTFTYRVCDTSTPAPFCSNVATVTVNVPNQFTTGPAAGGITTPQNTAKTLAASDLITTTGAPINPNAITVVSAPAHGAVVIDTSAGTVRYTPAAGYSGSDSFTIQLCDTSSPTPACRTVVVPVTVGSNAVTAVADTATTPPVTAVDIDVRANDTTATGQALANPTIVVAPGHGTATVNPDGTIRYTPAAQFSGQDTFTYRVCDTSTPTPVCSTAATVTVDVPNTFVPGPVILNGFTTPQNTPRVLQPTEVGTTTGAPVNRSGITQQTPPAHGTVTNNVTTGEITYTPAPGYSGPDQFVLQGCDLSTPTPTCQTLTFNVTVLANTVTANNDSVNTNPGTPVTIGVLANDTSASGQALAAPTIQTAPVRGSVTIDPTTKQVTYTPNAGTSGRDSFTYTVCDTSTPTPVCSNTATVTINVPNQLANGPATGGIYPAQNTPITTPVTQLVTVTGAPINPAAVTTVTPPAHGTLSINATTGAVTYTPDAGYSGSDSYSVQLCDQSLPVSTVVCKTVTVPIVVGTNTVQAFDDSATTQPVTAVDIDVKANDTTGGQPLAAQPTVFAAPGHGTATVNADGTIRYTPAALFSGQDTFVYRICDTSSPTPFCDTATVTIAVPNTLNPGPAILNGFTTPQNTPRVLQPTEVATTTGAPVNRSGITQQTPPAHGVVTNNTQNGQITYTPNPGYSGPDQFVLAGCDLSTPTPQCETLTFNVTVLPNTVTAVNDAVTTSPQTAVTIPVLGNDTSASGQPLAAPVVQAAPAHGTAIVDSAAKTIVYTPAAGFSGVDTFTYRVSDTGTPSAQSNIATVSITVPNTLTPGTAASGVTTPQNTAKVLQTSDIVTVTGAPIDRNGITVTSAPAHGTVSIDTATGQVTYTPVAGYSGADSFTLQLCDTSSPSSSVVCRSVAVPVTVGSNAVTAVDDSAATTPGAFVDIDVRANDTTATGQALAAPGSISTPAHGTAVVRPDGRIRYTPAAGFSGTDTFTYRVCDTSTPTAVCSSAATVTVTVPNGFTAGPAATGRTVPQNGTTVYTVAQLVTTTGAPIDPAGITVTSGPSHGTVTVNATTGEVTYHAAPGYSGPDSFTVQTCDTSSPTPQCFSVVLPITVGQNAVTAVNDTATTSPLTAVGINVRGNDTSASGQALATPVIATQPAHGTASVDAGTGLITYTPAAGFSGVDTFTYTVCDTSTPTPACSSPATVTVNVPNRFTDGTDASITTPQNTDATRTPAELVTTAGAAIDPAKVTITTAPAHGTISISSTTGAVTYRPAPGYSGPDGFVVQLCDQSLPASAVSCTSVTVPVTVGANTVTAVDDPDAATTPGNAVDVDVRANDTTASGQALAAPTVTVAPAHGTAAVQPDGRIRYTPAAGFSGIDTLTYRVCDTSSPTPACDTAVVTIAVPNALADGAAAAGVTTAQNTAKVLPIGQIVTVTGAAIDPGQVTVSTAAAHGTVTVDAGTGAVTYQPDPGYTGTDSFSIRACDTSTPTPQCRIVAIPVTVGANTVDAKDDAVTTPPVTLIDIDVRANDTTATGQALANPSITTAPAHGTAAVVAGTGHITYTPAAGFSGVDSFVYRVCDTSTPTPVCDPATVTVTVPNGFTPQGAGITTAQNTDATLGYAALVTTSGAPIDPAAVTVAGAPAHGSVSIDTTTGAVTYRPAPGYSGPDSFRIQLCDTSSPTVACTAVTVPVAVGTNTVVANPDSVTTPVQTAVPVDVRANDTTASGQPLANPTISTAPTRGSVTINATTGVITYTPAAGFSGVDTFTYRVCDTSSTPVCAQALVTITVPQAFVPGPAAAGVSTPQNTAITVPAADIVTATGAPFAYPQSTIPAAPANGTATVSTATGAVTYTPNPGFTGTDTVQVRYCDTSSPTVVCTTRSFVVTVGANTVDAVNDSATTPPVTLVNVAVRANDTTASGQPLDAPRVTVAAGHGTTAVRADGTIDYTPAAGFSGVDTFTYEVCDTSGTPVCDSAVVSITVPNAFTAGPAVTTGVSVAQNGQVAVPYTSIATVTGAPLSAGGTSVITPPTHGSVTVDTATGVVTYRPDPGYTGADTFRIQVCDTSSPTPACRSFVVPVTVTPNTVDAVDDPSAATTPVTPVVVDVAANDTSATGQALAAPTIATAPGHGTATVVAGGIRYTPAAGFSGVDTFAYRICDTSTPAQCDIATVTVAVPNQFTAGTAVTDGVVTAQNTAVVIPRTSLVSTTGAPVPGSGVSVTVAASHGTATVNPANGAITYTPDTGYSGSDAFTVRTCDTSTPTPVCQTYQVDVTVSPNSVVARPDSATVSAGSSVATDVRANDTTASGQPLAFPSVTTPAAHGTTSTEADGRIRYTPAAGFSGTDSYGYTVCDTSATQVCQTATVSLTIGNVFTPGAATGGIATPQNTPQDVAIGQLVTVAGAPIDPAGVTVQTAPVHGTVTIDTATGTATYRPTGGYSGPDSFGIRLCDTATPVQCTVVTVPVSVGSNVVTANPDAATTNAPSAVDIDVRANDTIATTQPLAAPTVTAAPAHGTTVVQADGRIRYTPATGFSGTDSFGYRVCDTSSTPVCDVDTVTVTVNNVFTTGPAGTGSRALAQNSSTVFTVPQLMTVSGAPLNPAGVTITSPPAHGSITIASGTGRVTYRPDPGYSGPDAFTVRLCDTSTPTPQCASVPVAVTVGVNTVDAVDDSATTPPATQVAATVRANDTTASGQALGLPTIQTGPAHGTATVSAAGDIVYTPAAAWSGIDTLTYRVCDTSSTPVCDTATLTITVPNGFLPGPAVPPGEVETPQNTAADIRVADIVTTTGSPIDVAGIVLTDPPHGTVTVDVASRLLHYVPDAGYTGPDSFDVKLCDTGTPSACVTYTITVTVGANVVAANNDTATVNAGAGTSVDIDVMANDTSSSAQPLGIPVISTAPAHGGATVDPATRIVTYTPAAGFSGADSFVYTLCDTSTPTAECDTATVSVTVNNVFTPGPATAGTSTAQNTAKVLSIADLVTVTGSPINPAQVTLSSPPAAAHGTITVDTTTGAVTYRPDPGYTGTDSFAIRLCDQASPVQCTSVTVPITVGANTLTIRDDSASTTPQLAVVIPVLGNDTSGTGQAFGVPTIVEDAGHGTTTPLADGTIRYTPAAGFSGTDTFRYRVCDTSSPAPVCGDALVTVAVPNAFTAGSATAGVSVPRNGDIDLGLGTIATTSGAPLNPAAVTVSDPPHGTATVAPDGTVRYAPDAGYTGTDSISVTVCDTSTPTPVCRTFVVPVTVGTNQVVANPDSAVTAPVTPVAIDVRLNDDSQTGSALGAPVVITAPAHGSTIILGDGRIQYTPAAGFSGTDSFRYRVCDASATPVCAQALVTVTVPNAFTDGPAAAGVGVTQNSSVTVPLAQIASTSGAPLRPGGVSVVTGPANGTVTVNPATGAVTYTPAPGFSGTDSVTLQLCDASTPTTQCTTVTIPFAVAGGTVTAGADSATTNAQTAVVINVRANDASSTGQALGTPTVATPPAHGTVTPSGTSLRYTPDAGFSGTDTFTYQICDTTSPTPVCQTATVTVTVNNVFIPGPAASGETTPHDTALTVPLTDIVSTRGLPADPAGVTVVSGPTHGTTAVDPVTGDVTFTPDPGYVGTDTIQVRVCDTGAPAQCTTVTIPIVVQGAVVEATNDAAATRPGSPVIIDAIDNDTSFSGYALAAPTIVTAPAHGSVRVQPDGTFRYVPDPGFTGTDTFTYQVCDTAPVPACAQAVVTITIAAAPAGGGGGLAMTGSGLPVLASVGALTGILLGLLLLVTGSRGAARTRYMPRHRRL